MSNYLRSQKIIPVVKVGRNVKSLHYYYPNRRYFHNKSPKLQLWPIYI